MSLDGRRAQQGGVGDPADACEKSDGANPFTNGLARAFVSDISTLVSFVDAAGNTITDYPAAQGYNPCKVQQFTNLGGANIWGLF